MNTFEILDIVTSDEFANSWDDRWSDYHYQILLDHFADEDGEIGDWNPEEAYAKWDEEMVNNAVEDYYESL